MEAVINSHEIATRLRRIYNDVASKHYTPCVLCKNHDYRAEFISILHLSDKKFDKMLDGLALPCVECLMYLAKELNVSTDYVLYGTGDMYLA